MSRKRAREAVQTPVKRVLMTMIFSLIGVAGAAAAGSPFGRSQGARAAPAEHKFPLPGGGSVAFSTTLVDGRECLRAAFVNHRTTHADVVVAVKAVEALVAAHVDAAM